ncbi:26214_t:CDS:1, partial [Dentiscutata erythropus]
MPKQKKNKSTKSPKTKKPAKKTKNGNAFFVYRTLLSSGSNRMEDHSVIASREWSNLNEEQKKIYFEIYELVVNKYSVDTNADGHPFITLQYNPNINKEESIEFNYSNLKRIYDMLSEKKSSTGFQSNDNTMEEIPTIQNDNLTINYPYYYDQTQIIS